MQATKAGANQGQLGERGVLPPLPWGVVATGAGRGTVVTVVVCAMTTGAVTQVLPQPASIEATTAAGLSVTVLTVAAAAKTDSRAVWLPMNAAPSVRSAAAVSAVALISVVVMVE